MRARASGTLYVVATPIGNLEDVTLRALRVLRDVEIIAAEDTRRTAHLLQHYSISTPTTSLHEHNERQKLPVLLERLRRGASVALVREPAGTPRPVLVGRPPLRRCGGAAKFHARCDQRRRLMPNITEANGLRSLNYRRTPKKRTSICGSSRITIPKPPPSPTAH